MLLLSLEMKYSFTEAGVVMMTVIIIVYTGKHITDKYHIIYIYILYSFNVDTFKWKELSPTTSHHGPMMKDDCGMVALGINDEDYLAVIGGDGSLDNNTSPQPGAQYSSQGSCNEVHMYRLKTGQYDIRFK